MNSTNALLMLSRRLPSQISSSTRSAMVVRSFAVPPSMERVDTVGVWPNEYPGHNYAFNWSLNGDGVTPIKKSAFRITKPLDLQIAGLPAPKTRPLNITPAPTSSMPEAGSDTLPFETFDDKFQTIKDALSQSNHLYCPEGHAPGSRTGVRVITNAPSVAVDMAAYLERMPRKDDPENQPVTVYALEGAGPFAGYAIEEVEVNDEDGYPEYAKSVAAVVVAGPSVSVEVVARGVALSVEGLAADEEERAAAAAKEEA